MKGIINKGIQEFVISEYGDDLWELVKEEAECREPFFIISEDYPDESTLALVHAISENTERTPEEVMRAFGKFWVLNTGKDTYHTYYQLAGRSPKEFLLNLNAVHAHVTRKTVNAHPPQFDCEERPDGSLIIKYRSERRLCQILYGLIQGVGALFEQELEIREVSCMHRGNTSCVMEISFP